MAAAKTTRRVQSLVNRFEAPSGVGESSADRHAFEGGAGALQKSLPRSGPRTTEGIERTAGNAATARRSENEHLAPSQADGIMAGEGPSGRSQDVLPDTKLPRQGLEGSSPSNGTSSGSGRSSSGGHGVESGESNCSSWERYPIAPISDSDLDAVIGLTDGSAVSSSTGRSSADSFDTQQRGGASDAGSGSGSNKKNHMAPSAPGTVGSSPTITTNSKNSHCLNGEKSAPSAGGQGIREGAEVSRVGKQASEGSGRGDDKELEALMAGARRRGTTQVVPAGEGSHLMRSLQTLALREEDEDEAAGGCHQGQGSNAPTGQRREDTEAALPVRPLRSQMKRSRSPHAEPNFADWTNMGGSARPGTSRYAEAAGAGASGAGRARFGDHPGGERMFHGWAHGTDPADPVGRGAFMPPLGAHRDHVPERGAGAGRSGAAPGVSLVVGLHCPAPGHGVYGAVPGMPSGVPPGIGPGVSRGSQGPGPGVNPSTGYGMPGVHPTGEHDRGWLPIPHEHAVGRVYEFRAARDSYFLPPELAAQSIRAHESHADGPRAQAQEPHALQGHAVSPSTPHPAGEGTPGYAAGAALSSGQLGSARPGQGQAGATTTGAPTTPQVPSSLSPSWSPSLPVPQFIFGAQSPASKGSPETPRSKGRRRGHTPAAGGTQAGPHWASPGEACGVPNWHSPLWILSSGQGPLPRQQAMVEGAGLQGGKEGDGEGEGGLSALRVHAGQVVAGWVDSMKANGGLVVAAAAGVLFAGALLSMAIGGRQHKESCDGETCHNRKGKGVRQGSSKAGATGKGMGPVASNKTGTPTRGKPPRREEGPKMVLHKVARGETLCSIAGCYGADPDEVVDLNVVNAQTRKIRDPDVIYPGEIIVVPSSTQTLTPKRR